MANADMHQRLRAFAVEFNGALGAVPLDRVIRNHMPLFTEARSQGFTWGQIAHALFDAGVKRQDGRPFSADHLRGAVSRQARSGKTDAEKSAARRDGGKHSEPKQTAPIDDRLTSKPIDQAIPSPGSTPERSASPQRTTILERLRRTTKLRGA